ncbi:MAG: ParM/StbA family protein, partial [Candidatus Nanopelagicales bacterium]
NLNDQYMYTDQYMAVYKGALHYIGEPIIDLLVVGLPLNNMGAAGALKSRLMGTHVINSSKTVVVHDVLVLPQPMGALYYCMSQKNKPEFEFLLEEVNLVIDPGFLTFDFLLSNGDKVIENRSNAHAGGISKILRAMADSISETHQVTYANLSAIDKGLRRRKLKINGTPVSLDEHINNTRSLVEGSVNFMKNIVGSGSDIDNIILAGGGAYMYRKVLEQHYPNHTFLILEDPQLANVKGFQLAGESYAAAGLIPEKLF